MQLISWDIYRLTRSQILINKQTLCQHVTSSRDSAQKCQATGYWREVIGLEQSYLWLYLFDSHFTNVSIVLKSRSNDTMLLITVLRALQRVKNNDTLFQTTVLVALLKIRTNNMLILTSVLMVLQKTGLTTHWSQLVCRQSYIKQDLKHTGLDYCINIPTKSRTNDTLVSFSVSVFPQKVGLTTHWPRLVYQQSYKKQDLRNVGLTIHWS